MVRIFLLSSIRLRDGHHRPYGHAMHRDRCPQPRNDLWSGYGANAGGESGHVCGMVFPLRAPGNGCLAMVRAISHRPGQEAAPGPRYTLALVGEGEPPCGRCGRDGCYTASARSPSPFAECRYMPGGTMISNRAPSPGAPFSLMEIPVRESISRTRNRPRPVFFP